MPLTAKPILRQFRFGSVKLDDPDPSRTPEEVAAHYSGLYPELTTARIKGPTIEGNVHVYTYERSIGDKG